MELLIGIAVGWIFCRILTGSPSIEWNYMLAWDKEVMAWRPISHADEIEGGKSYLAAVVVEPRKSDA